MAFYTNDGLKFETKEDAFAWFETTLLNKSPLGKTYEELHEQDWGSYSIEATGIDERNINIKLDNPNFDANLFRRVNYNTYGLEQDISSEEVIKELQSLVKTLEIVSYLTVDELSNIQKDIEKDGSKYQNDVFTEYENIIKTIQIEVNLQTASVVIQLADKVSGYTVSNTIELDAKGKIDSDIIPSVIQSFFLKEVSGKFDGQAFKAGEHYIDGLLRYAQSNDKEIKIQVQ
ncbi:hypothetical protein P3U41_06260 [Mammaliicoccus sciuri]|uniref:hypothetical protein n=1 Tax=Mammaliicoccus sciuri TaxID=1296 RepID=UPI002B260C77|nr:hypothetical protein [Mammaliicoccus sciuri]WQL34375.1 hypothetical protein P3U41_06260 [Mammaliicoccus sciuri]WQL61314.1 hypothetical protein P3T96_06260 [Mammaliicoccus sciuri]